MNEDDKMNSDNDIMIIFFMYIPALIDLWF